MKRISCLFLALIMVLTMTSAVTADTGHAASKVKTLNCSAKSAMKSVNLKWKKKRGVTKYVIYKKDVTKYRSKIYSVGDSAVKKVKCKKIAKVSGKKTGYKDKKAKKDHFYVYIVKAYKKNKLAYTTKRMIQCPGLAAPELMDYGNSGEPLHTNSKLYLLTESDYGKVPAQVILYRKAKGETKYKKIKTVKASRRSVKLNDATVKLGKVYYYKVKTRVKYKGKYIYSKYSNIVRIPNFRIKGTFTLEKLPYPSGSDNYSAMYIKMTSDKGNGTLILKKSVIYTNPDNEESQVNIDGYSSTWSGDPEDFLIGDMWKHVDEDGWAKLAPGETIYLRYSGKMYNWENWPLVCNDGAVDYECPLAGTARLTFNFKENKATVVMYQETE